MKKAHILLITLLILSGCSYTNKERQIKNLKYFELKYPMCYFAKTDSGFVLRSSNEESEKYFEYTTNNNEIKMYSDSLFDLYCGIGIIYSIEFYDNNQGRFRNRSICKLKPTGEVTHGRYVYKTKLSSFTSPEYRVRIKRMEFSINGHEFDIELDSIEIRTLLPTFEPTLYTAKGI